MKTIIQENGLLKSCLAFTLLLGIIVYAINWAIICINIIN